MKTLLFVIGLLSFSATLAVAQEKEPKKDELAKPELAITAEALGQAVQDDVNAAAKKYHLIPLEVEGIVSKRGEYKGEVGIFQFDVMVKDAKTGKMTDFTVFCSLKTKLKSDDKKLDEFAVGKKVTVWGKSGSMGNGQVTLYGCVIVRDEDKIGGKKKEKP